MTTIAFRDGVVAADRQTTEGHERYGFGSKIGLTTDAEGVPVAYGAVGKTSLCQRFARWAQEGLPKGDRAPAMQDGEKEASGLLFYADGRVVTHDPGEPPSTLFMPHVFGSRIAAFGSGSEYALGAMAMGADPKLAVEIACALDLYSGGGCDVVELSPRTTP